MKTRYVMGVAGVAGAVVAIGQLSGASQTTANDDVAAAVNSVASGDRAFEIQPEGGTPDVTVFRISGTANWSSGNFRAYSVGTTSCNTGEVPLAWFANTNQHPVIGQNMFRLAPGQNGHLRFEHLGQSWLKHGFCALSQSQCGNCQPTNCNTLGVGCSDPYTANRNGTQGPAGPKYQVNATNGFFPYPPADPAFNGNTARRLRVLASEVEAANNPGAQYFFEAQYVCPDENVEVDLIRAANNVSYREGNLASSGSLSGYVGETVQEEPAIYAWREVDPEVNIQWRAIAGIGNFFIGSRAYDNGDGTWDYEYAVHNLDSHRSVGSVDIELDPSVSVSAIGFRDVDYHSGEIWDGTDWDNSVTSNSVRWNTVAPFSSNPNGNAIRWGTMYNFRFTADSGPTDGTITLGLFRDGDGANEVLGTVDVPQSTNFCMGDFNENGVVGFEDLTSLLAEWGFCFECEQDFDGDFFVNFSDLLSFLSFYGPCP
ncbi:MAG: hypothetical protein AB8G96_09100 [Phycisphaerales bacterium]